MIEVKDLTKKYGELVAVDNISFEVKKGEVVGFLGPNAAGKTTTLRVITGFLPPTEGTAVVAGYDVRENPIEVKEKIGYLPEENPLYDEFEVVEFLEFIGRARQIKDLRKRIKEAIEICKLEDVVGKLIGHLSRGYRQRVGLAQAILHDPEIIIADEPTTGLDPIQQSEIRNLIKGLKERGKTILISTHILPEVQAMCERVIIIHKGKIVADAPINEIGSLKKGYDVLNVVMKGDEKEIKEGLSNIEGVINIEDKGRSNGCFAFQLQVKPDIDVREKIFDMAVQRNLKLIELHRESLSLEDVFKELTKE